MKNILLSVFGFCILSLQAQETKKVLFIGNSYTGANNLPSLIDQVANSTGDALIYTSHNPGGTTLSPHASKQNLTNTINSDNWDFVSIQAQSQEPSFSTQLFESETFPQAHTIVETHQANNTLT